MRDSAQNCIIFVKFEELGTIKNDTSTRRDPTAAAYYNSLDLGFLNLSHIYFIDLF